MRSIMILLPLFAILASAQAGTWIEDFNDGNLDGWKSAMSPASAEWNIENGQLAARFKTVAGIGSTSSICMEPSEWKDYAVEASVWLTQKLGGHMEMGLGLRVDSTAGNGYMFILHYVDNHIQITKNTAFFTIEKLLVKPYELSENTLYRMKCSVVGDHLSFYINDELCAEIDDSRFKRGTFGIYILNVHVIIDDIIITGDDIPDKGPSQTVDHRGKLATIWGKLRTE